MDRRALTHPTWERYQVLSHAIASLHIRDRRAIFYLARTFAPPERPGDLFFPRYGFTLAEFAVWYTLGDSRRKAKQRGR